MKKKVKWRDFNDKDLKVVVNKGVGRIYGPMQIVEDYAPGAYKSFIRHLKLQGRTIDSKDAMMHWSWYHAGWGAHRKMEDMAIKQLAEIRATLDLLDLGHVSYQAAIEHVRIALESREVK